MGASQLKYHSISVDQARYAISIVAKYLDTAIVKASKKFYKTTLPAGMIFTKEDVSTSDEQVVKLTREYNIHYRACIGSLIYLFSIRVDLSFAVQKWANVSKNPGKVHSEGLIHLLRYIRDNKTLVLKYYVDLNDAPVTDLLRQANIKTKNNFMVFSDSSSQDCPLYLLREMVIEGEDGIYWPMWNILHIKYSAKDNSIINHFSHKWNH